MSDDSKNTTTVVYGKSVGVPTKDTIRSMLRPFAPSLNDREVEQVQLYLAMLVLWNEKVSLTSINEPGDMLTRHFGESFLGRGYVADEGLSLADIGTGAGFPGLALKIVRPKLELHLVEQNAKKAAFLSDVVRLLAFDRVFVHRTSYEALVHGNAKFNVVTARALGGYSALLKWCAERLDPQSGRVILWLGLDEANRLNDLPDWRWELPRAIPGSRQRLILVGAPTLK